MKTDFSEVKEVKIVSSFNQDGIKRMNEELKNGTWILLDVVSGKFDDGTPYQEFTLGRIK